MNHSTGPCESLPLHDHVALDEIELYAEILIAVADTEQPLSSAEIDRILGLPAPAGPAADIPPETERTRQASGTGPVRT